MFLYVIRHAQSTNNALYAATGSSAGRHFDPPLTDIGHQQAQHLAQFLAQSRPPDENHIYAGRYDRHGFGLTHLYTSLMVRAITTATYIAGATGLPLHAWTEIHERGGLHASDAATGEEVGVPGPDRAFLTDAYPHLVLPETLGEEGWWNRPEERADEYIPRAQAVWQELLRRHGDSDDRVAIVTHGGFFQSLLSAFLTTNSFATDSAGISAVWFGMSNASVSRFEIVNKSVGIRYLNRVDFLPDELITG